LGPIPNPQSPIPNPQSPIPKNNNNYQKFLNYILIIIPEIKNIKSTNLKINN